MKNKKNCTCFGILIVFLSVNILVALLFYPIDVPTQIRYKIFKVDSNQDGTLLQQGTENSEQPSRTLFRVQFVTEGRCLGISGTKKPVVKFCNPLERDTFVFMDGKIRSEELDLCLSEDRSDNKLLLFLDCEEAIRFELVDEILSKIPNNEFEAETYFSALNDTVNLGCPSTNSPEIGAKVGLVTCMIEASKVALLEETSFLKDRAALLLPLPAADTCNFPACGVNKRASPVIALLADQMERCVELSECVTVVTKTARRPLYVIRLAKSLRKQFKLDLPIVVIDDGPEGYGSEIMDEIAKFPNMQYVISSPDLGIAEVRNMGLRMVKTKYFLILDDDMVATERTEVTKLVEILDTTDATLVGGGSTFAGFLEFGLDLYGKTTLFHYKNTCIGANQTITGFPGCFRCEITANIFVARTQDAVAVGGWSRELKIVEHKDFFLRLKGAGKKVVYCPEFTAANVHGKKGVEFVGGLTEVFSHEKYNFLRTLRFETMETKFCNHWNIEQIIMKQYQHPAWIDD